ncbi:MAG: GntR family transcriptional regulator, partial [Mesorhizobium sp.]
MTLETDASAATVTASPPRPLSARERFERIYLI